jgi:hypothetical protein
MSAATAVIMTLFMPVFPLCIHFLLSRGFSWLCAPEKRQAGALISVVIGAIPVICLSRGAAAYFGLIYACIGYSYFHFFNMSETSRRLRMMLDISNGTARELNVDEMVERRLARLCGMGELRRCGERYCRGRGFLLLPAQAIHILRRLLFPKRKGEGL